MSGTQAGAAASFTPPRYKLALISWLGAYAMITLILATLGPTIASWPLPLRTLLLSTLMVTALTWLVVPTLTRLLGRWIGLRPRPR